MSLSKPEVPLVTSETRRNAEAIKNSVLAQREKLDDLDPEVRFCCVVSAIILGYAALKKTVQVASKVVVQGCTMVSHFSCHSFQCSFSFFKEFCSVISNMEEIKFLLFKKPQITSIYTIGWSSLSSLIYLVIGLLETIGALFKYAWNSLWKRNLEYTWERMVKDLKEIWIGNVIAFGANLVVASGLSATLIAFGIATAWPFVVSSIAGSIIGSISKWWYNNRDDENKYHFPTPYAKTTRDEVYKQFAKSDNAENEKSGDNKKKWPEELDDLVWIFESIYCLEYVAKQSLREEHIDYGYERRKEAFDKLPRMEKLNHEAIWDFRKAISMRYLKEIKGNENKKQVDEVIVKACKLRFHRTKKVEGCFIM